MTRGPARHSLRSEPAFAGRATCAAPSGSGPRDAQVARLVSCAQDVLQEFRPALEAGTLRRGPHASLRLLEAALAFLEVPAGTAGNRPSGSDNARPGSGGAGQVLSSSRPAADASTSPLDSARDELSTGLTPGDGGGGC
jgi:hypothetical protein